MEEKKRTHPTRFFTEPDDMLNLFEMYKVHLKQEAKNWPKVQYVGKNGERVEDYPVLPMTYEGFRVFAKSRLGYIHQYFDNKDGLYSEFVEVCAHIKLEIRSHQITGGLLGHFHPSITQRLNNLTEKIEATSVVKTKVSWKNKKNE